MVQKSRLFQYIMYGTRLLTVMQATNIVLHLPVASSPYRSLLLTRSGMSVTGSSEARGKKAERSGNLESDNNVHQLLQGHLLGNIKVFRRHRQSSPRQSRRQNRWHHSSAKVGRPFSPAAVLVVVFKILRILELEAGRREEGAASDLVLEGFALAVVGLGPACAPNLAKGCDSVRGHFLLCTRQIPRFKEWPPFLYLHGCQSSYSRQYGRQRSQRHAQLRTWPT